MTKASDHIWGLVCGLPGAENRKNRVVMVLQAWLDESEEAGKVFVLGGYIASVEQWARFSDEWAELLSVKKIEEFKMKDARCREYAAEFYRVIQRNVSASIVCSVDRAYLNKRIPEITEYLGLKNRLTVKFRTPCAYAIKALMLRLIGNQERVGLHGPIDMLFDERNDYRDILDGYEYLKFTAKDALSEDLINKIGAQPVFKSSKQFMALQAADMYAWCVRKAELTPDGWKANSYFPQEKPVNEMFIRMGPKEIESQLEIIFSKENLENNYHYAKKGKVVSR